MIEVGSFIGIAAMTGSDILIRNAGVRDLGLLPQAFERLGINVVTQGDDIRIDQRDIYEIDQFIDGSVMTVADAPWLGLSPDLISILLVVAAQARGSVVDSSEDVREPPLLRRQADRHGGSDNSLRSAPRGCDRGW